MQQSSQDPGQDAEPSLVEKMTTEIDHAIDRVREEEEDLLRQQRYSFNDLGRNRRMRVRLGQVDAILAGETGWLSRACLSILDGAISGFLDAVRVQSRGRSASGSQPGSRTPSIPGSSDDKPAAKRAEKRRADRHRRIH